MGKWGKNPDSNPKNPWNPGQVYQFWKIKTAKECNFRTNEEELWYYNPKKWGKTSKPSNKSFNFEGIINQKTTKEEGGTGSRMDKCIRMNWKKHSTYLVHMRISDLSAKPRYLVLRTTTSAAGREERRKNQILLWRKLQLREMEP